MIWTVKPAAYAHVNRIANAMREIDRAECAAAGKTPKRALVDGLKQSTFALTVLLDDRPVAMLGVAPISVIEGLAAPWLLGTDEILKGARQFVTVGPRVIHAMQREWPRLQNYVGADNRAALRVLKLLGFDVANEIVIVGGMPMRLFSRGEIRV